MVSQPIRLDKMVKGGRMVVVQRFGRCLEVKVTPPRGKWKRLVIASLENYIVQGSSGAKNKIDSEKKEIV